MTRFENPTVDNLRYALASHSAGLPIRIEGRGLRYALASVNEDMRGAAVLLCAGTQLYSEAEREEVEACEEERDRFARLLTMTCSAVSRGPSLWAHVPAEVRHWWDQRVIQYRERLREEALAKLTPEEREVLGV